MWSTRSVKFDRHERSIGIYYYDDDVDYLLSILLAQSDFAGAQITAYMGITDVKMDCPEVVEPSTSFTCSITVTDGSDMTLSTNIGSPYHIGSRFRFMDDVTSVYCDGEMQYILLLYLSIY